MVSADWRLKLFKTSVKNHPVSQDIEAGCRRRQVSVKTLTELERKVASQD